MLIVLDWIGVDGCPGVLVWGDKEAFIVMLGGLRLDCSALWRSCEASRGVEVNVGERSQGGRGRGLKISGDNDAASCGHGNRHEYHHA